MAILLQAVLGSCDSGRSPEAPESTAEAPLGGRLVLDLRASDGARVTAPRVELLGAAYGQTARVDLNVTAQSPTISLSRVRSLLRQEFLPGREDIRVQLLVQAEDCAPMQSELLLWDGEEHFRDLARVVVITFARHDPVLVTDGAETQMELVLRRRGARSVRFVDGEERPVGGVRVTSYFHWSSENHCGALSGAERLDTGVSDRDGRVTIPDGDFEYALVIDDGPYRFPEWRIEPWRWVGHLPDDENVVRLHRIRTLPLEIVLRSDGKPLAEWLVRARLAYGCGVNFGPLATTDAGGKIYLPDYRDELYASVYVEDRQGRLLWSIDPRKRVDGGRIAVDIESR